MTIIHVTCHYDVQRFPESAGESDIYVYIHLDSAFNLNLSKLHTVVEHCMVVCLVAWALNESGARVDLVLIET